MSRKPKSSEPSQSQPTQPQQQQTPQQTQTQQQQSPQQQRLEQQVKQLQQQQQASVAAQRQQTQHLLQQHHAQAAELQGTFATGGLRKAQGQAMAGTPGLQRGSTMGSIPFAPGAPDMLYNSPDFKLLEERVVDQIRAVIHESELRTCRKFFEWIEWSNQQQAGAIEALRQELNLPYGNGTAEEAEAFAEAVHGGSQQSQETPEASQVFQATQPGTQATPTATPTSAARTAPTSASRLRTPSNRGRRTAPWTSLPRSETFAPRPTPYPNPAPISRSLTLPQGFPSATTPYRFNALDVSVLGPSLTGTPPSKRPPKLKTGTSTFALPGSPAAASFKIPAYKLSRAIKTVVELWQEWTVGFNGGPPVKQLEDMFKSSWRNGMAERQFFSRRKVLLDEVMRRGAAKFEEETKKREERKALLLQQESVNPGTATAELAKIEADERSEETWNRCHQQAAEELDAERGRISLNALSGKLRKARSSQGKGESYDGEHDEDAEGEGEEEETQGDTQMSESQLQSQLVQGDEDGSMDVDKTKKNNGTAGSQEDPLTVIARDVISQQHHPRPHPGQVPVLPSQPASQGKEQAAHQALQSHLAASLGEGPQGFSSADWDGFVGGLEGGGEDEDGEEEEDEEGEHEGVEDQENEGHAEERASKKRRTE